MKILYVIGQLGVGGTENQLLQLARRLDRTTCEPIIVSLSTHGAQREEFGRLGCPVHEVPSGGVLARLWHLGRLFRRYMPTIVQSFGFAGRAVCPLIPAFRSASHIATLRSQPPFWRSTLDRGADRLVLSRASLVVANTKKAIQYVTGCLRVPPAKCHVVYNGIDLEEFDRFFHQPADRDEAAEPPAGPVIGMVANLLPVKRHDVLLEAFGMTLKAHPAATLWIIGTGPLKEALEDRIRTMGLVEHVRLLGPRTDVPRLLSHLSIGVLSSDREGLSNALLEYMAARLPVVATRVGGNPEAIVEGSTGLLVSPGEPEAMSGALTTLLGNTEFARSLGHQGRERVSQHFTMERTVCQMQTIYEGVSV